MSSVGHFSWSRRLVHPRNAPLCNERERKHFSMKVPHTFTRWMSEREIQQDFKICWWNGPPGMLHSKLISIANATNSTESIWSIVLFASHRCWSMTNGSGDGGGGGDSDGVMMMMRVMVRHLCRWLPSMIVVFMFRLDANCATVYARVCFLSCKAKQHGVNPCQREGGRWRGRADKIIIALTVPLDEAFVALLILLHHLNAKALLRKLAYDAIVYRNTHTGCYFVNAAI
mgnify:CR=1 FL=1